MKINEEYLKTIQESKQKIINQICELENCPAYSIDTDGYYDYYYSCVHINIDTLTCNLDSDNSKCKDLKIIKLKYPRNNNPCGYRELRENNNFINKINSLKLKL